MKKIHENIFFQKNSFCVKCFVYIIYSNLLKMNGIFKTFEPIALSIIYIENIYSQKIFLSQSKKQKKDRMFLTCTLHSEKILK